MFAVHFFNNKNLLLTLLTRNVPVVGENLKIKGRKGTVSSVTAVDEKNVNVQVTLETIKPSKIAVDKNSKNKKR